MRHIRDAARAILAADDERLKLLAKHDPSCFRDLAAALLCARDAGQRQAYIVQQAHGHGRVNRSDLQREFNISLPQTAADFRAVRSVGLIRYDATVKGYVPAPRTVQIMETV